MVGLALAAVVAFVVGIASGRGSPPGPLRWVGAPRAGAAGDGQALYGTIVNASTRAVRLSSKDVRVVGGNGATRPSMSAFDGGYIQAYAGAVDREVVLRPGQREPLSVTWTGGDATSVKLAGSTLAIPQ